MDLLDIYIVIYLDNILIYSDNLEDHIKHMKKMLKRLQKKQTICFLHQVCFPPGQNWIPGIHPGGQRIDNR